MDHIIIEKVINNNIISAYEKSGAEVIVMGRGIGFKKKQGEVVPADQISKIFRIKSRTLTEQFKELLARKLVNNNMKLLLERYGIKL